MVCFFVLFGSNYINRVRAYSDLQTKRNVMKPSEHIIELVKETQ